MSDRFGHRLTWLALALVGCAPLVLARVLTPARDGVGTHIQLGLPPCALLGWLRLPCPGCGLTTSWAHLAHGDLSASLSAHVLGLPLFIATLALALRALLGIVRADPPAAWLLAPARRYTALGLTLSLACVWLTRLIALAS